MVAPTTGPLVVSALQSPVAGTPEPTMVLLPVSPVVLQLPVAGARRHCGCSDAGVAVAVRGQTAREPAGHQAARSGERQEHARTAPSVAGELVQQVGRFIIQRAGSRVRAVGNLPDQPWHCSDCDPLSLRLAPSSGGVVGHRAELVRDRASPRGQLVQLGGRLVGQLRTSLADQVLGVVAGLGGHPLDLVRGGARRRRAGDPPRPVTPSAGPGPLRLVVEVLLAWACMWWAHRGR